MIQTQYVHFTTITFLFLQLESGGTGEPLFRLKQKGSYPFTKMYLCRDPFCVIVRQSE